MSQRHTFRCFGLTLTESRGYECMVIYLQCSLTLDRDYFAYLTIDDAALLSNKLSSPVLLLGYLG